jgi:hypothetical protein
MQKASRIARLLSTLLLAGFACSATTLLDTSSALTLTDPTQMGRLSRNGIPQDWAGSELFPGVINTATLYHYTVFSLNVGSNAFIQVDFDSVSANTFVSAYRGAYLPNSGGGPNFGFDANWLGDAGFSGNFFGTDPVFFQVIVPVNNNLLVVVNNTAAGAGGVGDPFRLIVEGFVDTNFTEAPEPSAFFLLMGGAALLAAVSGRSGRRSRQKFE